MSAARLRIALDGSGEATPLDRLLVEAAEAGCEGAAPGAVDLAPAALAETLAARGVALAALGHAARLMARGAAEEAAAAAPVLDRLAAAGARVCLLTEATGAIDAAATPLRDRPRLARSDWPGFARRAGELARRLEDRGLIAVWRPSPATVVATRDDLLRLADGAGEALGVALDPAALRLAGADPEAVAAELAERLRFLIATAAPPDAAGKVDRDRLSLSGAREAGLFLRPETPEAGLGALFEIAARAGYAGWLAVAPPPTAADTVAALRRIAADAGFGEPGAQPAEAPARREERR